MAIMERVSLLQKLLLLLLCSCHALADIATYSLGDLKQYKGSASSTPTMTGSVVACSGSGDPTKNGIEVFISPELRDALQKVMSSKCKVLNSDCYQNVQNLIAGQQTFLETRQLSVGVAVTALASGFLGIFFPLWYNENQYEVLVPVYIPPAELSQASSLVSASTIAVAVGTEPPTITITAAPVPTAGSGAMDDVPEVVSYTSAANGHLSGDVVITLSKDLATRLQDFWSMTEANDCPEAADFHGSQASKRSSGGLAAAVCGTTNVLANGPFDSFRLSNGVPNLPWTSQDVVRAMNTVTQFALANAALLRITPAQAATTAATIFSLAWIRYMGDHAISTENVIPASELHGVVSATSACATASVQQCSVSCGFLGNIFQCNTACNTATSCGATSVLTTVTTTQWTEPPSDPTATACVAADYTPVTTVWPAPTTSVAVRLPTGTQCFCQCPAGTMAPLYWGTNAGSTTSSFCLGASPTKAPGDFTLLKGIGCAPTSTSTSAAAPPVSTSNQFCFQEATRYLAGPVVGDAQREQAKAFCGQFKDSSVLKLNSPPKIQNNKVDAIYYREMVSWINYYQDRCRDASLSQPVVGVDECTELLYNNWKNCNNGGKGGWIEVGCLRYEFLPFSINIRLVE